MINKQTISLVLSLISVAGVGVTSFLSVKGHEKAVDKDDKKEKLKCYAPAIASGVVTCACILGAHGVAKKEIVALTAACGYLSSNKEKVEKLIQEKYGKEALTDIRKETEKLNLSCNRSVESTGKGTMLMFDEFSGRFFYSSMEAVDSAERKLSDRYRNGHRICMNDFYELLGIETTTFGNLWGWMPDIEPFKPKFYDDNPLCFDDRLAEDVTTGKPVRIISLYNFPTSNWMYDY